MQEFFISLLENIYLSLLTHVDIKALRTEETLSSLKNGWGGKTINNLPAYPYFEQYINGEKMEALEGLTMYYFNRAINEKLIFKDKKQGGIKGGSAYQHIVSLHNKNNIILKDDLSNLDNNLVKRGFEERVKKRFEMIDTIANEGYKSRYNFIHATQKNGLYYLTDGHHRTAALALLGYKQIPVNVDDSLLLKSIRTLFRFLHH